MNQLSGRVDVMNQGPVLSVGNVERVAVSHGTVLKSSVASFPSRTSKSPKAELLRTSDAWGLYLRSLTLKKSFEGRIKKLFNPTNDIYFASIAWDYKRGTRPFVYPLKGAKPEDFIIPLEPPMTRHFSIGDGINIFPARRVFGSLNVAILVYECDEKDRKLGKALCSIHDSVEQADLAGLIARVSADPSVAASVSIAEAANGLMGAISKLMKENGNDSVDTFRGSFGAERTRTTEIVTEDGESAAIGLELRVA